MSTLAEPIPAPYDNFGTSVAVAGSTVVIAHPGAVRLRATTAQHYLFDGTTGTLLRILGKTAHKTNEWFGESVAISGNTVVVGTPYDSGVGAAQVFDAASGGLSCTLINYLPAAYDEYDLVATSGNTVVVGSPR